MFFLFPETELETFAKETQEQPGSERGPDAQAGREGALWRGWQGGRGAGSAEQVRDQGRVVVTPESCSARALRAPFLETSNTRHFLPVNCRRGANT